MKEKSISMKDWEVRATLAGTKTQTRRVIKAPDSVSAFRYFDADRWDRMQGSVRGDTVRCPYGQPGDRLWVRETWAQPDRRSAGFPLHVYAADWLSHERPTHRWRPSVHMQRAASRITLEITGVRVERLQDISEEDAMAEGITVENVIVDTTHTCGYHKEINGDRYYFDKCEKEGFESAGDAYAALWESINGTEIWEANPWVWVIEHKRI